MHTEQSLASAVGHTMAESWRVCVDQNRIDRIRDPEGQQGLPDAFAQTRKPVSMAALERGLPPIWT